MGQVAQMAIWFTVGKVQDLPRTMIKHVLTRGGYQGMWYGSTEARCTMARVGLREILTRHSTASDIALRDHRQILLVKGTSSRGNWKATAASTKSNAGVDFER